MWLQFESYLPNLACLPEHALATSGGEIWSYLDPKMRPIFFLKNEGGWVQGQKVYIAQIDGVTHVWGPSFCELHSLHREASRIGARCSILVPACLITLQEAGSHGCGRKGLLNGSPVALGKYDLNLSDWVGCSSLKPTHTPLPSNSHSHTNNFACQDLPSWSAFSPPPSQRPQSCSTVESTPCFLSLLFPASKSRSLFALYYSATGMIVHWGCLTVICVTCRQAGRQRCAGRAWVARQQQSSPPAH